MALWRIVHHRTWNYKQRNKVKSLGFVVSTYQKKNTENIQVYISSRWTPTHRKENRGERNGWKLKNKIRWVDDLSDVYSLTYPTIPNGFLQGVVHTTPEEFQNAALFHRFDLPSTLIPHENGAFGNAVQTG